MKKLNTYGLKIDVESLKRAAAYTETCYNDSYVQLSYDLDDGSFYAVYHPDTNHWSEYHSDAVISIGSTTRHLSEQKLIDMAKAAVDERNAWM